MRSFAHLSSLHAFFLLLFLLSQFPSQGPEGGAASPLPCPCLDLCFSCALSSFGGPFRVCVEAIGKEVLSGNVTPLWLVTSPLCTAVPYGHPLWQGSWEGIPESIRGSASSFSLSHPSFHEDSSCQVWGDLRSACLFFPVFWTSEHKRQKLRVRRMRPQLQVPGPELELAVIFFFNWGNPVEKDRLTLADSAFAKFLLELLVACMFTCWASLAGMFACECHTAIPSRPHA